MAVFGVDFKRARHEWLYPTVALQRPWRATLLFVLMFVVAAILQVVAGFAVYVAMHGLMSENTIATKFGSLTFSIPSDRDLFTKASVLGLFPSAILVLALAWFAAKLGLPHRAGRLALTMPKLGWLGWIVVVAGFGIGVTLLFTLVMAALGIDPSTYAPNGAGVSGDTSSAGAVEKTMAALAKDPVLFALSLPSVILGAPLTEEVLFRGALFSGIAASPLGRTGAVLITAALWALAHAAAAPWLFVGMLFVMGIILGLMLLRFGSLWVTIACHASWNALSSLALFGVGASS
jgi:uncharacterized protein